MSGAPGRRVPMVASEPRHDAREDAEGRSSRCPTGLAFSCRPSRRLSREQRRHRGSGRQRGPGPVSWNALLDCEITQQATQLGARSGSSLQHERPNPRLSAVPTPPRRHAETTALPSAKTNRLRAPTSRPGTDRAEGPNPTDFGCDRPASRTPAAPTRSASLPDTFPAGEPLDDPSLIGGGGPMDRGANARSPGRRG
jgi:hypothetical protein